MSNVVSLAPPIQTSASDELRKLADEIDSGELGEVRTGIVLIDTPTKIIRRGIGAALTGYEIAGILDAAKYSCYRQVFGG